MKKRPRRTRDSTPVSGPPVLQYKVVELSIVDEGALERTLNEWVPKGWKLDGVQFAMRESSKRPAMAFVFFTREGEPIRDALDESQAQSRLHRIAEVGTVTPITAHERLAQLAGGDDDEEPL
jgi:hypothetical protein